MGKDKGDTAPKGEQLLEEARKTIEKEGAAGWNLVKETLLRQETRNARLKEAINYATVKPDYFRPAVVSLCSEAIGGSSEVTIPYGASLVMLAKAIGIHDDIIDKLEKRGRHLTLFGKFGKEIALIISDILLFKGFALMQKDHETEAFQSRIFETIEKFWFEQSESEIQELHSRGQTNAKPQECLAKIEMRASELEATTRIGGILGGGSALEVEALGKYGRFLGIASILRDELIDMLEPKMLTNRIRNESLPLPLIYALQKPKARPQILSRISKKRLTNRDLATISRVCDEAKGMSRVAENIAESVQKACSYLDFIGDEKKELKLLATSLVIRPTEWKRTL